MRSPGVRSPSDAIALSPQPPSEVLDLGIYCCVAGQICYKWGIIIKFNEDKRERALLSLQLVPREAATLSNI